MTESTDHAAAIRGSAADPFELQEQQALAAYRVRQARGETAGVAHAEAFRRLFGADEAQAPRVSPRSQTG
ncbi:hypothetical protein RKE30_21220 [Streptomyces sp. Li-HN-5-11]|uniref:hypothetical protein n=1 Tax=Streptomyces sp. Li-HN-5-11 TaxID=3075432 RepID=UPI0028B123A1|nr:hypothetical protein [Streptomyces sp. Li-HN-5-11]WNM32725.1 hypothetical protein RKE30_21095 [Streptomyces sp. Li-HN-5-11]WNM32745.1 hypothetical protein RKE30_21220 [Streptomyces sp. Li-HN-5-11]WOP38528.1 hypothetical protein RKE32_34480 [Streptomyces sp. Li-HN-5-13]